MIKYLVLSKTKNRLQGYTSPKRRADAYFRVVYSTNYKKITNYISGNFQTGNIKSVRLTADYYHKFGKLFSGGLK